MGWGRIAGWGAAVLVLWFSAATQAQQPASGKHRILMATVNANYREGFLRLGQEYEQRHPDIEVRVQFQPGESYATWLLTQVTSGEGMPDIINVNFAAGFYERGLLISFTPYLPMTNPYTGRPWIENLESQLIEKYKQGNDAILLPLDFIEVAFFYNKTVYDRLGLLEPRTWEEMIAQAKRVRAAGYIPFAIPGDTDSYWAGPMGWVFRFVTDAYTREFVPIVMSQPGDWDYDPKLNDGFHLNLHDPYNDAYVLLNQERLLEAIRNHTIRIQDDRFRAAYRLIKEFSEYWEKGFNGTTWTSAYQLFITQKAAVMIGASQQIEGIEKDLGDLLPEDRFEWGAFAVPAVTQSVPPIPPFRGVGGAGTMLGGLRKDDAQTSRVADFLMYLMSPESARVLVEEAVKARQPLIGPILIPGVKLPEKLERRFAPFKNRGFEKISFRGVANMDDQEAVWKWTVWAQRYLDGRVSLEQCLAKYQQVIDEAAPRVQAIRGFDMNPKTKDVPR